MGLTEGETISTHSDHFLKLLKKWEKVSNGLTPKIGFQGVAGCNSDEAISKNLSDNILTNGYDSFKAMLHAVEEREVTFGLLPVENSATGAVIAAQDLLFHTDLKPCLEVTHRVIHNLLVLPGVQESNIRKVYSHEQALSQCSRYLDSLNAKLEREKRPTIERIVYFDTAGAAKDLKEGNQKIPEPMNSAVIASMFACDKYTLEPVAKGINDMSKNYTRFLLMSSNVELEPDNFRKDKTTLILQPRDEPGGLLNVLKPFADNGINISWISTKATKNNPWEYYYYVDFEGNKHNPRVEKCLEEVKNISPEAFPRVIGSYPMAPAVSSNGRRYGQLT